MLYEVKEVWVALDENGLFNNNMYESFELLEQFEGQDANAAQGYVIADEFGTPPEWAPEYYDDYFDALMDLTQYTGGVYVGPDCIAIYEVGEEIVYWHQDEWLEDPTVAVSIANAIRIFYEEGSVALKEVIGRV